MADGQTELSSKRMIIVAIIAILGLIGVSIFLQPKSIEVQPADHDQDAKHDSADDKADTTKDDDTADADKASDGYSYTASAGDSYTYLARQVVAIAGGDLSPAQRVAAETKLTQDAGAPLLEIGQSVEFDQAVVKSAVDWAASLSGADEAAWQSYADTVILPEIK